MGLGDAMARAGGFTQGETPIRNKDRKWLELDKEWNNAIDAAAKECSHASYAIRAALSGAEGGEPGWEAAQMIDGVADAIRKLKRH